MRHERWIGTESDNFGTFYECSLTGRHNEIWLLPAETKDTSVMQS